MKHLIYQTQDEVVPVTASRDYAQSYPDQVRLIEVDAGHDTNTYLPQIWALTEQFLVSDDIKIHGLLTIGDKMGQCIADIGRKNTDMRNTNLKNLDKSVDLPQQVLK